MKRHPNLIRFVVAFGSQILVLVINAISWDFGNRNHPLRDVFAMVLVGCSYALYFRWLSLFLPNGKGSPVRQFGRAIVVGICSAVFAWTLMLPAAAIARLLPLPRPPVQYVPVHAD